MMVAWLILAWEDVLVVRLIGSLSRQPARVSFWWYASTILFGTVLLTQPFCCAAGAEAVSIIDAMFTATSALCVTGLTVRSTGHDLSFWGQVVVLLLIQAGGIGIVTLTTFVTLKLGGRQTLRSRTLLADTLGAGTEPDLRWVLRHVIRFTLIIELMGAALLMVRFQFDYPLAEALWHAVFHSIAAFCNAGFGLHDDNLIRYQGDWIVNPVIMLLIISGGIGYPVMIDLSRNWYGPWRDRWDRLMLHTKIMLVGTASLLTLGTAAMLILEWDNSLSDLPISNRLLASMFQSVTCRTAGFNTIEIGTLTNATLFIFILLMMIGAGPCSTGGGFKVSTMATLVLRAWSTFRGATRISVSRRTLPEQAASRAVTTTLLYTVVVVIGLTCLLTIEQSSVARVETRGLFLDAAFEVVSALGTVGLSTGITPYLSWLGKAVLIVLMFIGRLGPITVVTVLSLSERERAIEYASEEPLIG
jgi:trk system potassium uptake protein TrkH